MRLMLPRDMCSGRNAMEVAVESFVMHLRQSLECLHHTPQRMAVQVGGDSGFDLPGTYAQIVPNRPIKFCFGDRTCVGEFGA